MALRTAFLGALLAAAAAAAPKVALAPEKAGEYAIFSPGQWVDLVITVDPAGDAVALEGLEVLPTPSEGVEFGGALLPPTDQPKGYGKPFALRLPAKFGKKGKQELTVTVRGRQGAGAFEVVATAKVTPQETKGHMVGTAALKNVPAQAGVPNALLLKLTLREGYHVYGSDGEGVQMTAEMVPSGPEAAWSGGGAVTPPGGDLHGEFSVEVPFTPLRAGKVDGRALLFWQACDEAMCDPSELAYLPFQFEVAPAGAQVPAPVVEAPRPPPPAGVLRDPLWKLILKAIGAGLFALAMPCTYPMIPITISFFTKQGEARQGKTMSLALAYGAGIIVIFAGIGAIVGLGFAAGRGVLDFANNPWVNGLFALLFLVFGLSLIGLFEIRLPSVFNDLAAKASGSGGFLSVFAMGMTLVITSFTCTAPFVGTLLVDAGKSGEWGVVTLAMGVFGLTMAAPFVLLALSPGAMRKLPRSGEWMKHLKVTLGIVELGLVLKFVSNVDLAIGTKLIGRVPFLVLWSLSFLAAALYLLGAFELLRRLPVGLTRGRIHAASWMLLITVYLWFGVSGGRLDLLNLEAFLPEIERPGEQAEYGRGFRSVVREDYAQGVAAAKALGAPIFLHFTGFQ